MAYAKAMSGWLDWQKAFRLGVLLILPPEPLRTEINGLRARYDPRSHDAAEAHISLTVPFQKEPGAAQWAELEDIAARFSPLMLRYGPLKALLPNPGAALHIEPQEALNDLRVALEACAVFQNAPPRAFPFWAHMTIAEFVGFADTQTMLDEIGGDRAPQGVFRCDRLSHLVPDEDFRFTERRRLRLGAR